MAIEDARMSGAKNDRESKEEKNHSAGCAQHIKANGREKFMSLRKK